MSTLTTTEARKSLSDVLSRAQYAHERTVLTRNGEPVAAIVPLDDLEAMEALEDAMDVREARKRLREAGEGDVIDIDKIDVPD